MTLNNTRICTRIWMIGLLIGTLFILPSCDGGGGGGSDSPNQVSLELGETTLHGSALVDATGSLLFIDNPDDPLNGLEIDIPEGAYQEETNFTVSHTPIISHSGDVSLDPVTPLIKIENGGEYSDEIITVKIPVTIEDGYHYMAFYYNEATGKLEGIPEIEHDETSLTIATRHFSMLFINRIFWTYLLENTDSGFQVTKDNWQFTNLGTYLSPGGICSGMSVASLYYYTEKKKNLGQPQLFGRYNNGTSSLEIDDDQAIKLCSTIQDWWDFQYEAIKYYFVKNDKMTPLWTYFMFAHSLLKTGEPQYVAIYPPKDDSKQDSGHALVVYKKSGNDFYVADPNYPKDKNTKIEFELGADGQSFEEGLANGKFKPYASLWNPKSKKVDFERVYYIGKDALIDADFNDLWNNLNNKTVPWNKKDDDTLGRNFPWYELKIIEKDATGTEKESALTDGYKTTNSVIKVKVEMDQYDPMINVFYEHTGALDNHSEIVEVNLKSGDNNVGFQIEAELFSGVDEKKVWAWTDFKYFNIKLEEDTPDPPAPLEESSIIVKNTYDEKVLVNIYIWNGEWFKDLDKTITLEPGEKTTQPISEATEYKIVVRASGLNPQEWRWQPTLDLSDAEYTYDFFATQDCDFAKFTVTNQTQYRIHCSFDCDSEEEGCGDRESTSSFYLDANETDDAYLKPGIFYTLSAHASTGMPNCKGDECYVCWDETFKLNCQGNKTILSGSGTPCDF
ncbi:MAG: hypothetical protein HF978_03595 [Desulfobacteraceae bacterium]|nr:hypothetical protein [Desulfobacteraceae bacterium]MBC2754610.1 hypothetical protein [Desulfobacteraceae bacterium]